MPAPLSTWAQLGYSSTPYSTAQIPMSAGGEQLLVGRDSKLESIHQALVDGVQLIALEGDFGVGKSSLAAVAAYDASTWFDDSKHLFLAPSGQDPLELQDGESFGAFQRRAYYRIAAAILEKSDRLKNDGLNFKHLEDFKSWLLQPSAASWSAGIGLAGFSTSGSRGRAFNTSVGFSDAGVMSLIDSWMKEIFQGREPTSGIILVLDNLENLGKFDGAINLFEGLRDTLFRKDYLIWFVCGAEGMVRTAFNSKKMAGVFHEPIDIPPLAPDDIPHVIEARALALRTRPDAKLPVSPEAFGRMYEATGKNLRFALGIADGYATRIDTRQVLEKSTEELDADFLIYLQGLGNRVIANLEKKVTKADWKVLRVLVDSKSGFCSPSEFRDFGYADMPPLITRVKALQEAGLVRYTVVKEDGRRRLISASENGRLAMLGAAAHERLN